MKINVSFGFFDFFGFVSNIFSSNTHNFNTFVYLLLLLLYYVNCLQLKFDGAVCRADDVCEFSNFVALNIKCEFIFRDSFISINPNRVMFQSCRIAQAIAEPST